MVELGRKYKCVITGFEGVATGYVKYITGCDQVLVAPAAKNGSFVASQWLDEQRLIPVGKQVIRLDNSASRGFDMPAPTR